LEFKWISEVLKQINKFGNSKRQEQCYTVIQRKSSPRQPSPLAKTLGAAHAALAARCCTSTPTLRSSSMVHSQRRGYLADEERGSRRIEN
jgi:hypothetical protein